MSNTLNFTRILTSWASSFMLFPTRQNTSTPANSSMPLLPSHHKFL
ncbi:hypothetical protein Godav_001803, partial [Gossypium davidsonii]|nr:hypothetical protein [Gossypium davidsonii]